jgi:hypothetical protein
MSNDHDSIIYLQEKVAELEGQLEYLRTQLETESMLLEASTERITKLEFALRSAMKCVESDGLLSLCQQALQTRQDAENPSSNLRTDA